MRHLLSLVTTTNFRDNGRRKINKIAAISAGFSLLLLGIVAVMFGASSQPAYAENPPAKFRDAIDSSHSPIDAKTVSGSVKKLLAVPSTGNISATADLGEGIPNVTVYVQWTEGSKSKGRWASPIYKGTTDASGNFSIKMLPYTDVNGVKRTFDGEVGLHSGGMYNEKIQIWVINPKPENLNQFWGYGQRPSPDGNVQDSTGKAYWGNTYGVKGADTYFVEKQDPTKTSATIVNDTNSLSSSRGGHISGKVYWNWVQGVGSTRWVDLNNPAGDKLVRGQKVQASYLSDCAVKQVEKYYADNKATIFQNHTFRASASTTIAAYRWDAKDEANLQKYIQEQIPLGTGSCQWIAETVQATTGADGKYTLQFNGSWGNNQRSCQTVPAGKTCGAVADSPDDGSWEGIGKKDQKHVNWDYLNVSLVDKPDGIGYMDPWRGNNFFDTRSGAAMFKPTGVTGNYSGSNEQWDDLNLGLVPVETYFDVLEYDTSTHAATPGSTVNTSTEGLAPANKIDGNKYRITWYDPSEKQVGHCERTADNSGILKSCPFKVPVDLKENTVYNAVLTSVDEQGKDVVVLGADSFLAVLPDYDANYQQTKTKVGVEATSAAPTFDKKDTDPVEQDPSLPEGYNPVFELDKAKMTEAGLNEDDFSINPSTGAVTWKSPAGEDGTVISVPVKMTYSKRIAGGGSVKISEPASVPFIIQAPLDDDGDGVANDKDKCSNTPTGLTVQANGCTYAQQYDTSYETTTSDPGASASSGLPKFQDTLGSTPASTTPPVSGISYQLDTANLPAGVNASDVSVNPNSGEVTWNIPQTTAAGTYNLPVKLTYPNSGGTKTANAPFKVNDAPAPPAGSITNPGDKSSKAGEAITPITVSAENIKPGTLTVSGLPDGLSFDPATKQITGTPTTASPSGDPSVVTIKAVGKDGKEVTQTFKYTVTPPDKPATITPIADQSGTAGQPINPIPVEIANGVEPPTFTGLPDGLGYDPNTGTITGTVNPVDGAGNPLENPKTYPVTVKVKGQDGKVVSTSFSITINPAPKPDTDKDGVDDTKDVCPGTKTGLKVDTDGCAANQKYLPEYSSKKVAPGASVTVPAPTYKNAINGASITEPAGTKYALDTDHLPSGVKASDITVNPDTGAITWNVPTNQVLGDVSIPVKVTFPDKGGTLSANAKVSVASISNGNDPKYQDAPPVDQGGTQTLPTPKNPDGSALPDGTHYSKTSGPDWITVDSNTGAVTIKPQADTPAGDYNAVIHVTYPDGTYDDVTVPVHVNAKPQVPGDDSDGDGVNDDTDKCPDTPASAQVDPQDGCTSQQRLTPVYDGTKEGTRGIDTVTVPAPTFKDKVNNATVTQPTGTTYTLGAGAPTGATINSSTGAITWVIPKDATIGNHEIPVAINYGDGSKGTASAIVKVNGQTEVVTPEYKPEIDPIYGETEVIEQGKTQTTKPPIFKNKGGTEVPKPDGTEFYKADGMPDWVSVDENTGAITMTPGLDANPQDYNIKVVVKYKDGTQDTAVAKATVTQKPRASATITQIPNQVGKQGDPLTPIPIQVQNQDPNHPITVTGLPKGLTYDQAQGKIVGTPTEPTNDPQTVTVTAIGEDGAPVSSTFTFTVNPPDQNTIYDPKYSDPKPGEAGATLKVPGPKNRDGKPLPAGTSYTKVNGPDWVTVDPDTGAVTAKIPADAAPGDYPVTVKVTYPDGTTENTTVTIHVAQQKDVYDPKYSDPKPGEAGATLEVPGPKNSDGKALPTGTTYSKVSGPDWVTVDPDTGAVTAKIPANAAPGDYPVKVRVTYPDKTSEVITLIIKVPGPTAGNPLEKTGSTAQLALLAALLSTMVGGLLLYSRRSRN